MKHIISNKYLSIDHIKEIIKQKVKLELSDLAKEKITICRKFLDDIAQTDEIHYGINTGFGSLCNTVVSKNQLSELQRNLVISHACGLGEKVEVGIVKLMLLLKIQGLSYGRSGVQLKTVERLIDFYKFIQLFIPHPHRVR